MFPTGTVRLLATADMTAPKRVESLPGLHVSDDRCQREIWPEFSKNLGELSILDNGGGHELPIVVITPELPEEAQDL